MWWSENAVPGWLERSLVAAFLIISGFVAALALPLFAALVTGGRLAADLVPDALGAWFFWHPESLYAVALACGLTLAFVVDRLTFARR